MKSDSDMASEQYVEALTMCDSGNVDLAQIYILLTAAAESGDIRAKYAVATWLLHGKEGVIEPDVEGGVAILKELESCFIPEALFDLAVSIDFGKGVRRDERRAFSLYMRAALLGHAQSCEQISEFYREGKIVKHNRKLQEAWALRAEQEERDISPPYRVWLRPSRT